MFLMLTDTLTEKTDCSTEVCWVRPAKFLATALWVFTDPQKIAAPNVTFLLQRYSETLHCDVRRCTVLTEA